MSDLAVSGPAVNGLVLASRSASRRAMLSAAGVPFVAVAADIDERALEATMADAPPADVALALAATKALAVSTLHPGRVVLGSDSLVVVAGRRFDKPASRAEAAAHLRCFSGKTMTLTSAAVLARDGAEIWRHVDQAHLAVRPLSDAFIADYLAAEWPDVAACVGVFRVEGLGINLFDSIAGSHFTVLGMPLLAVLGGLRAHGVIAG